MRLEKMVLSTSGRTYLAVVKNSVESTPEYDIHGFDVFLYEPRTGWLSRFSPWKRVYLCFHTEEHGDNPFGQMVALTVGGYESSMGIDPIKAFDEWNGEISGAEVGRG